MKYLTDEIDWDNMPKEPSPQYPALLSMIQKCQAAAREEAMAHTVMEFEVYSALDELRFGVEQLTGDQVPPPSPVTRS